MFCRGRPVCRPGYGSLRDLFTGGHIGPPLRGVEGVWGKCTSDELGQTSLRGVEGVWEPAGIGAGRKSSPAGRGGARPLQGERSRLMRPGRRGVVTPPYGCNAGGAKQRADVGIGPYGKRGKFQQPPGPAAHSGASAARMGGVGGNRGRVHPQRGQQPRTIPQSRLRRASSLCTREPLGRKLPPPKPLRGQADSRHHR